MYGRRVCTATQFARKYRLPKTVPALAPGAAPPNAEEQSAERAGYYKSYACKVMLARGRGDRKRIPACLKRLVRQAFPDPNGSYVGHQEGNVTLDE